MKKLLILVFICTFATPLLYASDTIKRKSDAITGFGPSFSHKLYQEWIKAYYKDTGYTVNYIKKDLSQNKKNVKNRTIDFIITKKPLKTKKLKKNNMHQFPVVVDAIAIGYNLPGINNLKLSRKALVGIATGMIKFWDNQIIAQANPGIKLPHEKLLFVHHSSVSWTTYNFTYYLSKISRPWKLSYGARGFLNWPGEQHIKAKNNFNTASTIKDTPYSIGYLNYTDAKANNIVMASLQNKTGKYIQPNIKSFNSTISKTMFSKNKDFYSLISDINGEDSYPLMSTIFALIPAKEKIINKDITKFYSWCYENGQDIAKKLGFAPLPEDLVKKIKEYWNINGI